MRHQRAAAARAVLIAVLATLVPAGAASAAPAGAVVADSFNRPDSAGLGSTETGQPWTVWWGSASISNQQAVVPSEGYHLAVVDTGTATASASVTVATASPEFWLVLRASDAGSYWRFGRWQGGPYQLQQVAGWGLGSPAVTTGATVQAVAGDRLSCLLGTGLSCSVNGTAVASTNDTFNGSARFVGFAAAGGGTVTRFDDLAVTPPPSAPDLGVDVTSAASSVNTGSPVTWTANVTNRGNTTATATVATITLPAGLTATTVSTSAGSCSGTGTSRSCALGSRAVGSLATVTVRGTAPATPASLTLAVAVSASETDADPSSNTDSETVNVRVPPPPNAVVLDGFNRANSGSLGTTETGQPWAAWSGNLSVAGQQAEASPWGYALSTVDTGTAVGAVEASVTLPSSEYWLVVRASDSTNYWRFGRWQGGPYQLQQVVGNALGSPALSSLGSVPPGSGDRLSCQLGSEIRCSVNGTAVVSTADGFNATARRAGLAAAGGTATRFDDLIVTTPPIAPDLRVTIAASASSVATDSTLSWTATVRNAGTVTATSTVVTVTLPSGLRNASVSSGAGPCVPGIGKWTCTIGSRAVGSSATVSVTGRAPTSPTTLTLGVSAAAKETDAYPADNSASNTVTVRVPPPPGTLVVDGFERANGPLGTTETSQAWTGWIGDTRVVSRQAEASGAGYSLAVVDSGTASGTVSANVTTVSSEFWLIVRASTSSSYWRFGRWQNGAYQLQQVQNNALGSPPVSLGATITPAAGDRLSCRLGTGLTCSVNGVTVVSTTDGFNATARNVGFAAGTGGPARFDDLLVVTPPAAPDLRVGVTAAKSTVTVGTPVSWSATVGNDGTLAATGVTASVVLSGGATGVTVTSSAGLCSGGAGNWTCALGSRPVASTASITVQGTAPAQPATLVLTVSATAAETDADPSSNTASAAVAARYAPVPGEVLADDFDRPDASTLGHTNTGQPWTTWSGAFRISSNRAAAGVAGSVATVDPAWTYGTYEVTVAAGASDGFAVILRGRDATNHFRVGPDGAGNYRLWKVVNGSARDAQFQIVRADVRARDGDVIRIVNRPDDGIWVGVNGQHVIDGGDVDLLGESRFGLAASSAAVRFDNLWITQTMSSGMTTVDDFGDPDGTPLDFADSGTRYPWRSSVGHWESRSGRAVLTSTGSGLVWMDTTSELADVRVTVVNAVGEAWLIFRYGEAGGFFTLGRANGGTYEVVRVGNEGSTVVASSSLPALAGDVLEVRQLTDGAVEAWVRGVRIASFRDTTFNLRATGYGLLGEQGSAFDHFVAVAK